MATPEKKQKGNQGPGSILETPMTQATEISKSTSSKKNQKSPNSLVNDLTAALNNTSISGSAMMNGFLVMDENEMRKGEIMNETLKNNSKKRQL